jgi:AbrB family looped-hinge helix DNA binding protein
MVKKRSLSEKRSVSLRAGRKRSKLPAAPDESLRRESAWAKLGPGGRIVIPAPMRAMLGIGDGDHVQLRVVEGELRVVPQELALRRVQEFVARYVPKGVSLVDELIEERRREAELEERGD